MGEVTIRDLRNHGGRVLERVARGEVLTVTRDGHPVAELRSLPRRPVPVEALLNRWCRLPVIDPTSLREDIDDTLDSSL